MKQRSKFGMANEAAEQPAPRRRMVRLALVFLVGALVCTSAWAAPGGHGGGHGGGFHGGGGHVGGHGGYHGHGGYSGYGGRGRVGFFVGGPAYWGYGPGWYGYPYYDYWPVVVPQRVIVSPPPSLWYFCDNPQGYYPYIKQCSTPWRTVVPDTTPPPSTAQ